MAELVAMPTIRSTSSAEKHLADLGGLVVVEVGVLIVHLKVRALHQTGLLQALEEALPAVVQGAVLAVLADADQVLDGRHRRCRRRRRCLRLPPQAARDRIMVRDRPQAASFFRRFIIIDSPIFDTEDLKWGPFRDDIAAQARHRLV